MYFVTGIRPSMTPDQWAVQAPDVRCFGYYPKWLTAVKRVMPNACDINEAGCYPYVVVERIRHGLHPFVEGEWWFIFDESSGRYRRAAKPEWAAHISNWALG